MTVRRRVEVGDGLQEGDRGWVHCYVVPPILMGLGVAIDATQVSWRKPEIVSRVTVYPGEMLLLMTLAVVTILAALMLAGLMFHPDFGDPRRAALKTSAITLFGSSIAIVIARLDRDTASVTGMAMGWSCMILIYWACFAYLFRLEIQETILTLLLVAMGQALALWAVLG